MPKENDLEGQQDQGGKHGGQAGMPKPEQPPPGQKPADTERRGQVVGDPITRRKARGSIDGRATVADSARCLSRPRRCELAD